MPGTRIGDFQIEVSKLPTMQGVKLSARLGRVIGPAMAKAFQNGLEGEVDLAVVAGLLFDRLHPDELEVVLRELLSCTTCNGKPIMEVFDVLFADKLELVIPLVKYVMSLQFGSFFDALLAAGRAAQAKAGKESASTSTTS
jgi:hypothetical protein